jgi:hypothetical protein
LSGDQRLNTNLVIQGLKLRVNLPYDNVSSTVEFRNLSLIQTPDPPLRLGSDEVSEAYLKAQSDLAGLKAWRVGLLTGGFAEDHPSVRALDTQITAQQNLIDNLQASLAQTKDTAINWNSFVMGGATGVLALLAGSLLTVGVRRWAQHRHDRELRQIASLDG